MCGIVGYDNGKFLARLLRVEQDGRFVLEDEGGSEREYLFKDHFEILRYSTNF